MIYVGITLVVCVAVVGGLFILTINTLLREQNEDQDGDEQESI